MVSSETNTGNVFERFLSSNLADILTPLLTIARKWPRPAYVQHDFYQLRADFKELGRYFPALETLH